MKIIKLLNLLEGYGISGPNINGSINNLSSSVIDKLTAGLNTGIPIELNGLLGAYVGGIIDNCRAQVRTSIYDYSTKRVIDYRNGNDKEVLYEVSVSNDPTKVVHWIVYIINASESRFRIGLDVFLDIAIELVDSVTGYSKGYNHIISISRDRTVTVHDNMTADDIVEIAEAMRTTELDLVDIPDSYPLHRYCAEEIAIWLSNSSASDIKKCIEYLYSKKLISITAIDVLERCLEQTGDREAQTITLISLETSEPEDLVTVAKWVDINRNLYYR